MFVQPCLAVLRRPPDRPAGAAFRLWISFGLWVMAVLSASAPAGAAGATASSPLEARADRPCPAILRHRHAPLLAGEAEPLCRYAGHVVLIVNTASRCGYTEQYRDLQRLYDRYRARGFVILGFPANAFGQQEPGSNRQIAEFCEANFGVRFPMFAKIEATPLTREPLFAELARRSGSTPGWNFHKYLISRDGERIVGFASGVEPLSDPLTRAIERELGR